VSVSTGKVVRRRKAYRHEALWVAALVHRLSGLALALFLPLHFLVLGLALEGEAKLEGFLRWTDLPAVKLAEALLVLALAVHLLGGLRVLAVENLTWRGGQKGFAIAAAAVAVGLAVLFLVVVV
jgi:fumarate reductase subunit D